MKSLLAISAGLALLSGAAHAQVGQFDTIYQEDSLALEARYTVTLGAQREGRFSVSLIDQDWTQERRELTLMSYDRQGFAAFGITESQIAALNDDDEDDGERNGSANAAIIVGLVGVGVVGALILGNELADDLGDGISCVINDDNCE